MLNRRTLEADHEVQATLSSWGAKSIAGCASFIFERMHRADALGNMGLFNELKKHIEYFSKKSDTDLSLIASGSDFSVEKDIFLDFANNCLAVCVEYHFCMNNNSTVIRDHDTLFIKDKFQDVKEMLIRIQTQLTLSSWVVNKPHKQLYERIMTLGSLLRPMAASGMHKIRVGSQADGGYVMLDDLTRVQGALSFGINDDDRWDRDIVGRGIEVHQYDHTIEKPPTVGDKFKFFKEKIVGLISSDGTSIATAVTRMSSKRLILKCDIEGSEWDVFSTVNGETLRSFSQIVCEFHGFGSIGDDTFYAKMKNSLDNLHKLFSVVHIHANNSGPWVIIAGVPFPSVIEVTYANRDLYSFEETTEIFPTKYDYPNAPSLPELYLGNFRYKPNAQSEA